MRFLVDESSGRGLAELLVREGHDVVFVGNVMPQAPDDIILAFAERERRILVTDDRDFGLLVFRLQRPTVGVVFLRLPAYPPRKKMQILKEVVGRYTLDGYFTAATTSMVRQRKI